MTRPPARIAIITPGVNQFDSRAHRIARSLAARGDTVTIYARHREGLATEELVDGYRIVRLRLRRVGSARQRHKASRGPLGRWRRRILRRIEGSAVVGRFREFPLKYRAWARGFEEGVEPHDIWHGMWAGSLPALERIARRHGGRTVYDPRDVFLRSRAYAAMPGWQRLVLSGYERRWAKRMDAVLQVSERYASMMRRDLGLREVSVIRNCAERWDPPVPRPDLIRELLSLPASTSVVLYQGLLIDHRGIEQTMEAMTRLPDALFVCQGFGAQESRLRALADQERFRGRVRFIEPVPPAELRLWAASADVMVMCLQPTTENHAYSTPQKLWEAMGAGVPVVASDLPGLRAVVSEVGCGVLVDPADPAAIAEGIGQLLALGPEGLRAMGDRGLAAAHETYDWDTQFRLLDALYGRLLGDRAPDG